MKDVDKQLPKYAVNFCGEKSACQFKLTQGQNFESIFIWVPKMVDFMDLEEDYNDISVRGAQRRGQKYHCNPTLSP